MNVAQTNKEKGFTIIEVVLVLAIAGLIFLMVFIALPALQRNQRDTQRKNDLSRAQTAVQNFQSNNRNKLPVTQAEWNSLRSNYLQSGGDTFDDPSRGTYQFALSGEPAFDPETPRIYIAAGKTCEGESLSEDTSSNKVALRLKLEGGGIACVNN